MPARKRAVKLTRVSCDRFRSNQMRVTQSVIAIKWASEAHRQFVH
jgi:hypothetical protein